VAAYLGQSTPVERDVMISASRLAGQLQKDDKNGEIAKNVLPIFFID